MEFLKLIGLKVVAVKGFRTDMRRKKHFSPQYILFDDGKTYIELEDQDYITYHDCATSAKHISIMQSEASWKIMMEFSDRYPDADTDIGYY